MRTYIVGIMMFCCAALSALAQTNRLSDPTPKQQATWLLAVHTSARRVLEAAESLQRPDADLLALMRDKLTSAILDDVPGHQRRKASEKHCREAVRKLLLASLSDKESRILEVANEQSIVPIVLSDVKEAAGKRYDQLQTSALESFEKAHFDTMFETVRSRAVARQRQAIDRRASAPPFDVLDALLISQASPQGYLPVEWSSATQHKLRENLQSYAGRTDEPVLEEVATYANGVADRMIDGIRQQYRRQLSLSDQCFEADNSADVCMAEALAARVMSLLSEALAALPNEENASGVPLPVYPAFETVKNYIREKAVAVETERFSRFLEQSPLLDVSATELTALIDADRGKHRKTKDSRRLALSSLTQSRRPAVVTAYVGKAGADAVAHFAELLNSKTEPANAFNTRLADGIDAVLPGVRKSLADAQYASAGFAALDKLETLPESLLNEVHATRGAKANTLEKALSFLAHGGGTLKQPKDLPLFEETEKRALTQINGLVETAHRAINEQMDLLNGLEKEKLESLKADVAAGRQLSEIQIEWSNVLTEKWRQHTKKQASPYDRLTPPVQDALNKTLRQLYTSVQQQQTAPVEAATEKSDEAIPVPSSANAGDAGAVDTEPPPQADETTVLPPDSTGEQDTAADAAAGEGASSGGNGEGKADRPMPDILLVFSGNDARTCNVVLTVAGDDTQIDQSLEVDDPSAAADMLFNQIEPRLTSLLAAAKERARSNRGFFGILRRSGPPTISVSLVVESNAVRHRMSLLLKQRLDEALALLQDGDQPVTVDWQAGLSEQEGK
jgi:hypothetical protein